MNIIAKAAENLPGHWHQGYYFKSVREPNMCGIGHVMNAAGIDVVNDDYLTGYINDSGIQDPEITRAVDIMSKVAIEQYPDRMHYDTGANHFVAFNDHPETTEDDVVVVLEKAAIKFDEQV